MKRFKKILVGIDLSWGDRYIADELSPPNVEAIRQAIWLARLNSASVDFFFSLDISARTERLLSESSMGEPTIIDEAKDRLAELATKTRREEGIEAESHVVVGKSWAELIYQVLRNDHDLVLVGTRHMSATKGFFLGSTSTKLLRKCPCAVWVTQPRPDQQMRSILVAHDLRSVGDLAMELGCSMATLQNAQLHVLHADQMPDFKYRLPEDISDKQEQEYQRDAESHIESQLASAELSQPAKVYIVKEPPDVAIMNCIQQHEIDLVVMGTVGRTGISGFITGNTAERLLPQIPCSLLAVKPPGFKSPVTLVNG